VSFSGTHNQKIPIFISETDELPQTRPVLHSPSEKRIRLFLRKIPVRSLKIRHFGTTFARNILCLYVIIVNTFNSEYRNSQPEAMEQEKSGILISSPWEGTWYAQDKQSRSGRNQGKDPGGPDRGGGLGRENFVDTIIKKMKALGVVDDLKHGVADKRADNAHIPLELLWALGIDAKMKVKIIPYAIEDGQLLAEMGMKPEYRKGLSAA
jgi:hypothetical protein